MNVELADERFLILKDRFSMDHAEGRASTKRIDAFGTLAKVTGFLSKPKEDEFELVYRERRLQPFWRLVSAAGYVYERTRRYPVAVPAGGGTGAGHGQSPAAGDVPRGGQKREPVRCPDAPAGCDPVEIPGL